MADIDVKVRCESLGIAGMQCARWKHHEGKHHAPMPGRPDDPHVQWTDEQARPEGADVTDRDRLRFLYDHLGWVVTKNWGRDFDGFVRGIELAIWQARRDAP